MTQCILRAYDCATWLSYSLTYYDCCHSETVKFLGISLRMEGLGKVQACVNSEANCYLGERFTKHY